MRANSQNSFPKWALGLIAILVPAGLGLVGVYAAVRGFQSYGWTLFLALPILVSFLSAFILRRFSSAGWGACYGIAFLSILALGLMIIAFAIDGLICLLMAFPLAALLALIGAALGYALAAKLSARSGGAASILILMTFPAFLGFERAHPIEPAIRQVTSSLVIDAPIQKVWDEVIAFDRISGRTDRGAAGNGLIMRLAPVPMFYFSDASNAIAHAAKSSLTTHGATTCVDAFFRDMLESYGIDDSAIPTITGGNVAGETGDFVFSAGGSQYYVTTAVPEPGSLALALMGAAGIGLWQLNRRRVRREE